MSLQVNIENDETLLQSSATSHLFQYPKMVIGTIPVYSVFVIRKVHNVFDMRKLWIKDKAGIILQKMPRSKLQTKNLGYIYVHTMLLKIFNSLGAKLIFHVISAFIRN